MPQYIKDAKDILDGVIVIDKPSGCTSHDVVAKVKRTLGAKKVGHLGTLDPMATGVLPLVINKATKLAQALGGGVKGYEAVMLLGADTDTYDAEGKVTETFEVGGVTKEQVIKALRGFIGKIQQLPPMYSAVKKNGTPLYKLARKGVTVERSPKEVEIFNINDIEFSEAAGEDALPSVSFKVTCSRGTYIRSLCYDAGKVLGTGAHLARLRRTQSGDFSIEASLALDSSREELVRALIPIERLDALIEAGTEKGKTECEAAVRDGRQAAL